MDKKVFLLNKSTRNRIMLLDLLIFFLLLIGSLFFYVFSPKLNFLFFIPVLLFIVYKLFLFNKRGKALFFDGSKIYGWRSGWIIFREIKKMYIKKEQGESCIFVDLNIGWYTPTVYSDWSLYALPSTLMVLCQKDVNEPLELVLDEIKKYQINFSREAV